MYCMFIPLLTPFMRIGTRQLFPGVYSTWEWRGRGGGGGGGGGKVVCCACESVVQQANTPCCFTAQSESP